MRSFIFAKSTVSSVNMCVCLRMGCFREKKERSLVGEMLSWLPGNIWISRDFWASRNLSSFFPRSGRLASMGEEARILQGVQVEDSGEKHLLTQRRSRRPITEGVADIFTQNITRKSIDLGCDHLKNLPNYWFGLEKIASKSTATHTEQKFPNKTAPSINECHEYARMENSRNISIIIIIIIIIMIRKTHWVSWLRES